jgi:uncharacterized protein (DUF2384 family)
MASSPNFDVGRERSGNKASMPTVPASQLANYQNLVARAVAVFGDELKASRWLSLQNPDLDDETPLQAAQKHGYNQKFLEPMFIRIEHGIDY